MDVQHPDPGIPSAGGPLGLDGALESVSTKETPWSGADKDAFQTALQAWINQTAAATDDPANPNRPGRSGGSCRRYMGAGRPRCKRSIVPRPDG